jgi:hypothetical protein
MERKNSKAITYLMEASKRSRQDVINALKTADWNESEAAHRLCNPEKADKKANQVQI